MLIFSTKSVSFFIKLRGVPARFNAKFAITVKLSPAATIPIATLATAFVNNCQICTFAR